MLSPLSGLCLSMASHSDRDFRPFTIVLQSVFFVSPRNIIRIADLLWHQYLRFLRTTQSLYADQCLRCWHCSSSHLGWFLCGTLTISLPFNDWQNTEFISDNLCDFICCTCLAFAILPYLNIPMFTVMKIDQHDNSIFNSVLIVLMYILLYKAFENQTMKSMDFHSRFGPGSKRLTNTNYRQRKSKLRRFLLHVEKSWTSGGGVWFQKFLQSVNQTSWFLPEVAMHAALIIRGASSILSSTGGKNDVGLFSLFPREK